MPCSEKRLQANRDNALKSTGPKSAPGKARVAMNALKHGLRAETLVLPGEDAAAFDAMRDAWMADWQPPTDARRVLVEQAVAHAWRLRRCLKVERDHLIDRGEKAVARHRRRAAARACADAGRLRDDPDAALAALLATREGAEEVLEMWRVLADAATFDAWDADATHHRRLLNLLAQPGDADAEAIGGAVYTSWRLAVRNDRKLHRRFASDRPADDAEAERLAAALRGYLAEQVAEVERYIATRFPSPEHEAARVASSAALDDSPEGRALLRYEGQHGREFRAVLNQLIKLTQTGVDLVDDEPEPAAEEEASPQPPAPAEVEPSPPSDSGAAVAAEPAAPDEATADAVPPTPAPNKAIGDDPVGRGLALFRAQNGLPRPQTSRRNR